MTMHYAEQITEKISTGEISNYQFLCRDKQIAYFTKIIVCKLLTEKGFAIDKLLHKISLRIVLDPFGEGEGLIKQIKILSYYTLMRKNS